MLTPLQFWRKIDDKLAVGLATIAGVAASIAWPWLLDMALRGMLPRVIWADLVRLLGASIIAIILAVRADKEGTVEQRQSKAAVRRRMRAALLRGFAWQAGIAAITAAATGAGG